MFKPGDKIMVHPIVYTVSRHLTYDTLMVEEHNRPVIASNFQKATTSKVLRQLCNQMRSVAGPQGRFWIREVFEKATGEKME